MRKILLEERELKLIKGENNEPVKIRTADIIRGVMTSERANGITLAQMAEMMPVYTKMQSAIAAKADHFFLENAEYQAFKNFIADYKFKIFDPTIYELVTELNGLPDIPAGEKTLRSIKKTSGKL